MYDERPIVFTITSGTPYFSVTTKDPRGAKYNRKSVSSSDLFPVMVRLSSILGDEGHAVLFEAD